MPLADRLIQAAADFKERPWGHINFRLNETFDSVGTMPSLTYFSRLIDGDQFRVYVGLLSPSRPLNKETQSASDDDDEDCEEEMAAYIPVADKAGGDPYPLVDPWEAERLLETKEERAVRVFLEDPERTLKIFFTSYFIDKGLMWCVILFFALTTHADSIPGKKADASTPRSSSGSSSHSSFGTMSTVTSR